MKKIIIFVVMLVAVAGVIGVSAFNKNMDEVVGYIDGTAVKTADLQNYVTNLLGDSYQKKMDTKEGRQELFGHYVNRTLLLEYAKQNVKKDDGFVQMHTMGKVETDSALLSSVLKTEINDKVKYTEKDVNDLMESDSRFKSFQEAERQLISDKRIDLFNKFMENLRAGHKISLAG